MTILQNCVNTLQHIPWNASVAKRELVGYFQANFVLVGIIEIQEPI